MISHIIYFYFKELNVMNLITWYKKLKINIAVENINEQATYFGFLPKTESQWIDELKRIQPIVKMSGISMRDFSKRI